MPAIGWNMGSLPEECRPDRIGIVATECGTVGVAGEVLPVVVLNQSEPGACQAPSAQALMSGMAAGGWVLLVVYGADMHIVYDRSRYASISEAQIEVAFRYERSQDAAELKSLGAVNEDYRPLTRAEAEATLSAASNIACNDPASASRCSLPTSINGDSLRPPFRASSTESENGTTSSAWE